jgi:hypothetical protein
MRPQAIALARLRILVLALTAFLVAFSVCGFVLLDTYLLSIVSETRLSSIDRTKSYLQGTIRACLSLRTMQLAGNGTSADVATEVHSVMRVVGACRPALKS